MDAVFSQLDIINWDLYDGYLETLRISAMVSDFSEIEPKAYTNYLK